MRAGFWLAAGLLMALIWAWTGVSSALAQPPTCSKADFEAVVDDAAGALRELTRQNTPPFQAKLRQLKDKRGWSSNQFLKEAEPFVRDETISGYDQKTAAFLARITGAGQTEASARAPDCALLVGLRATMTALLETQKAKWAYMVDKIDKELRK